MGRFLLSVVRRDLTIAARRRGDWLTALFFFVMVSSLFPLGVGPEPQLLQRIGPGVLWVAATLASCAERYADCTLREWAFIDARIDPRSTPDRDLRTLALGHVAQERPARGTAPAAGMPPLTASRPRAITPPLGRTG